MGRRSNDPAYEMHEPPQPRGDQEGRLSAREARERAVERENDSQQVHERRNTGAAPPSEVRKAPVQD